MAKRKSPAQLDREIAEALSERASVRSGAVPLSHVDPSTFARHPFQDQASRKGQWTVAIEDGYVKVKRDGETIAAGVDSGGGGKRLTNIEFVRPEYQLSNRTRQKAMKLLQAKGYR